MNMSIRITCINKDNGYHENPYIAISHLGWENPSNGNRGKHTRLQIYNWINDDEGYAYVEDANGKQAKVITAVTAKGTKYLKTVADETKEDNLLSLRECSG